MGFSSIKYQINPDGVALITLNRPEVYNAVNIVLCEEVAEVMYKASEDEKVRVIVVTGEGKAYSSGGDINMILNAENVQAQKAITVSVNKTVKTAYTCSKPIIGAVNGAVAGGGICFVVICDMVFASEKARFACNFLSIAACPDGGSTYFMPRQVGYRKAFELLMGNQILSAHEAERIGLINQVLPHGSLMEYTLNFASKLSKGPAQVQAYTKWLLREGLKNDLAAQLELENFGQMVAWSSDDFREGTRAFFEKRRPEFKGS